jgi:FAD/FMN-containing dehydrogenase/Fe-S oxidoreductase
MTTPSDFERRLRQEIRGGVFFDQVTRGIYATDASHYQVMPRCVVTPRDQEDAVVATRIAGQCGVPITARGGGTSLSGQTTWHGMILDLSQHLDAVIEVNVEAQWARVEAGVIRDRLNEQVAKFGLQFAPDPATGSRAAIGGMVGNNSSGTRSIIYGKTIDHVIECKVALADGSVLQLKPTSMEDWRTIEAGEGRVAEIHRGVRDLIETHHDEILRRFPKVMRRVSGYNLDAFLPESQGGQAGDWNLAHLIVGSEGTLGVLLEAKVRLVPQLAATAICVVHFADIYESLAAVEHILTYRPSAVELLDRKVIAESRKNPTTKALAGIFEADPESVLIIELVGDDQAAANAAAERIVRDLQSRKCGFAWPIRTDQKGKRDVWELRKLGLGLIENLPGKKGLACIEDTCVPVASLAKYIREVHEICRRHGSEPITYAHASVGVLHVRPELDLHAPDDVTRMRAITEDVFRLVQRHDGSFSSEHGDGLVRGEFVPQFFGEEIYGAFRKIKHLFDPQGVMNPRKIVDAPSMTENLRYGENYHVASIRSNFHYRDHGSLQNAVEKCSGVGACRKLGAGTMCPSYMATRDERHTTRGRANALRMAMTGQLTGEEITGDAVAEVLELCLACKACKTECPTSVDMARFKSDVLQMRYDRYGTPQSAKFVGNLPKLLQRVPLPLAKAAGWLQRTLGLEFIAKRILGFDPRRPLPQVAAKSFLTWHAEYRASNHHDFHPHGNVVLFADTFMNFFEPELGKAAVRLLEGCGYDVQTVAAGCCQRTAISKGLLHMAKSAGEKTVARLAQFSPETPIVVLEPSCASSFTDDLPDLVDNVETAQRVGSRVLLLEQFLEDQFVAGHLDQIRLSATTPNMIIHVHCHQKSLYGTAALSQFLSRVPGLQWSLIDAGCCGMAGSFGYEHYDLSQQIGEDRLFPAIRARAAGTAVAATGTSCRQQIRDSLNVDAKHWCELITARVDTSETKRRRAEHN